MRALQKFMDTVGVRIRFTPPARAVSHSRLRRLWVARCSATSDDEQAVSMARLGPFSPRR